MQSDRNTKLDRNKLKLDRSEKKLGRSKGKTVIPIPSTAHSVSYFSQIDPEIQPVICAVTSSLFMRTSVTKS